MNDNPFEPKGPLGWIIAVIVMIVGFTGGLILWFHFFPLESFPIFR